MLQARWSLTHQYKFLVVKDDHLAAQYGSLITENSNKGCLVILAGMHTLCHNYTHVLLRLPVKGLNSG